MNMHQQFIVARHLTKADELLDKLRRELIAASQAMPCRMPDPSDPGNPTPEERELRERLERIYRTLYADDIPAFTGGDSKFFNFGELIAQVYQQSTR